jgi:hypothetical protein
VLTVFVVVATANHYWLDGIAAVALLVLAWFAAKGVERLRQRVPVRASLPALSGPVGAGAGASPSGR